MSPRYQTSFLVNINYFSTLEHNFPRAFAMTLRELPREQGLLYQARTQICQILFRVLNVVSRYHYLSIQAGTQTSPLVLQITTRNFSVINTRLLGPDGKHPSCFSRLPHDFPSEHRLPFPAQTQPSPLILQATARTSPLILPNFPGWHTNIPAISPGYQTSFLLNIEFFCMLEHRFPR